MIAIIAVFVAVSVSGCYLSVGTDLASPRQSPIAKVGARPIQDCGPRALLLAAKEIGITNPPPLAELTNLAGVQQDGASMAGMTRAAKAMGLSATGVQMDEAALSNLSSPALAWVDGNHYVAVLKVATDLAGVTTALIHDPNKQDAETMAIPELLRRSGGVLLLLEKDSTKKGN